MNSIPAFSRRVLGFCLCVAVMMIPTSRCQEQSRADSVDRDYSSELPRISPKSPQDAMATFAIKEGFRIEQVAAEPLVCDPVAISFDENGRLYVVEMRGYSENDADRISQIRLLDDTDGDGRFDQSHLFANDLSWPTAIFCYAGGVFVADAPDLYFMKDTDGDNRADERRVVLTGFGKSNVQGLVNSFHWGLDNRIHGATSSAGAELTIPGKKDGEPALPTRGRDFAIDPRTLQISLTSGGAQHGMSFNQWGDKFVCSNSDHIQHVVFEDRYVARNPYYAPPSPRRSIATDGPQAEVFRTSPIEPWRIVRTRLRVQGIVPGPVEGGGRAAGYFTGATGVTIYRGDAWPQEFLGWAFVGDVGSNLVHRKRVDPSGATFTATRVDEKSEFLTSNDIWFRPCQFANAPDGCFYVLDVYREVIEHPASLPPVVKKHLDLTSGRDAGRIYRIVPDGFRQRRTPQLGEATTAELVTLVNHRNGWHRDTAARLLYERQDRAAIVPLAKQAVDSSLPEGRIASMYALDGLDGLTPNLLLRALADEHPRVREAAVRLSEKLAREFPAVEEKLISMASDDEFRVRYQLAFALGELSTSSRLQAISRIAIKDASDPYMTVALMSSLNTGAGEVLRLLAANGDFRRSTPGREWLARLAQQIGKQQSPEDIAEVLAVLRSNASDKDLVGLITTNLSLKSDSSFHEQVAAATGGESERVMRDLLARARDSAADTSRDLKARIDAIYLLRLSNGGDVRSLLLGLLQPSEPAEIQTAAIRVLSSFDEHEIADALIQAWPSMTAPLRSIAADALGSREPWLVSLLQAVIDGRIPASDLDASRLAIYASSSSETLRNLVQQVLEKNKLSSRSEVLHAYRPVLETAGDKERGKAVFAKNCSICHQLAGSGFAIGPNLATMRNRGPEAILTNVLSPNQEVNPQYVNYVVLTKDGRQLTGMISAETATSVTLRRAENQSDTVLRIDIEEMRGTGASLMPEGLEKQIDLQDMADLLEYLKSVE